MTQKEASELLENKALDILHVKNVLEQFAGDELIEGLVAMNLSLRTSVYERQKEQSETMCELLLKLSTSKDMSVRWAVAKNPHTSIEVLEKLSTDNINLVRALVATNPLTPIPILKKLFNDEKIVRDGLSGNPSTPLKYLEILADDNDTMVRLRVIENPSTSKAICEKLLNDAEENIRQGASAKLKRIHHANQ
ncbi:MAG: hypothetical protein J0647_11825 [Campylobacteraceae bacterium]|nr:hypothetical protein [Campylobacteraceae bacterium]